jgi:hypothetical protein
VHVPYANLWQYRHEGCTRHEHFMATSWSALWPVFVRAAVAGCDALGEQVCVCVCVCVCARARAGLLCVAGATHNNLRTPVRVFLGCVVCVLSVRWPAQCPPPPATAAAAVRHTPCNRRGRSCRRS